MLGHSPGSAESFAVFPPAGCRGPLGTLAGVGTQRLRADQCELLFDRMLFQHSFTPRSAHPQLGTNWWELQPKRAVVRGGETHYLSYPSRHHGQSGSDGDGWSVGQRGGTLTGMAVANTAEAQSHYNTRRHGTHRGSEEGVLNCSRL